MNLVKKDERDEGILRADEIDTALGKFKTRFLEIDEADLHGEVNNQAADFASIAAYEASFEKIVANKRQALDELYAELWGDLNSSDKKMRVDDIKQAIERNDDYQKLKREVYEAEYQLNLFKLLKEAFKQKTHLLQSKIGLIRSEMNAEVQRDIASQTTKHKGE